jgi:hypothetical protein
MKKTRVVHCKKESYDVYIGRSSDLLLGKWGNPYSHKDDTIAEFKVKDRKESIEKFEQYLLNNKELMESLHELKGKTLGCWCKPSSCHGDILKKYADSNPLF